jgi:hypothetical protein
MTAIDIDTDALRRCLLIVMRDPRDQSNWQELLASQEWYEVARRAAYRAQCAALALRPWQEPPCVVSEDDPNERDPNAQNLLRRMLAAGLSRFEPDPLAALEQANSRKPRGAAKSAGSGTENRRGRTRRFYPPR